jgi:hypothetical protein
MIAKILEHRPVFKGVGYNTKKIDKQTGELMLVQNFGALQGLSNVTRQDYMSYLQTWSSASGNIRKAQFHAVISAKGQESHKIELTGIAVKWMEGMGYDQNPYLVVFHKDTENNHVHIVSSRVGPDGKKINDSFERVRSQQVLEQIMGFDRSKAWEADLNKALDHQFSSRAQFLLLLELKGYRFRAAEVFYEVFKGGEKLTNVSFTVIDEKISRVKDPDRIRQLKAVLAKYQAKYSTALTPVHEPLRGGRQGRITGYTSALSETLRVKFGIQLVFHASGDKAPYGYTIIDHAKASVYKGGEIMPLKELLVSLPGQQEIPAMKPVVKNGTIVVPEKESMLPGLPDTEDQKAEPLYEPLDADVPPAAEVNETSDDRCKQPGEEAPALSAASGWFEHLRLEISPDIDDEQINGRNRRRKRKARTNTR